MDVRGRVCLRIARFVHKLVQLAKQLMACNLLLRGHVAAQLPLHPPAFSHIPLLICAKHDPDPKGLRKATRHIPIQRKMIIKYISSK